MSIISKCCVVLLVVLIFCHSQPLFANISLSDSALKSCVDSAMSKANLDNPNALLKLKCHNKGIRSLAGLEAYNGLEELSLFGNKISTADLRAFKNLKSLNLAKNKLEELHIEGLSELEQLFIFKNNLKTINFDGLAKLSKVRAMQNDLLVVDITPLVALEEAYFWDNQLEDLQISGLEKLKFLDVKQNPMPDELYDFYDQQTGITISHDGNADDWK